MERSMERRIESAKADKVAWEKAEIAAWEDYLIRSSGKLPGKTKELVADDLRNCGEYTLGKFEAIAKKYNINKGSNHAEETYRHYLMGS